MSVNDLAKKWLKWCKQVPGNSWGPQVKECANDLNRIAQNGWYPVSEPPTEEDGNEVGDVVVYQRGEGTLLALCNWKKVSREFCGIYSEWARIQDVVLLPDE